MRCAHLERFALLAAASSVAPPERLGLRGAFRLRPRDGVEEFAAALAKFLPQDAALRRTPPAGLLERDRVFDDSVRLQAALHLERLAAAVLVEGEGARVKLLQARSARLWRLLLRAVGH